ncbi:Tll0287-like domain-containing protein [Methylacidimicrobium cyclopophantes]|uniref:Tll0287-like domain-containing protein n=1 Tax=Methylacidimicrobium cyclopophantes TaxID=1041766 RepID=UPI0015B44802|nr:DUF3365 domain-containing protein [Methylacidimicrobium cyclopophantes]
MRFKSIIEMAPVGLMSYLVWILSLFFFLLGIDRSSAQGDGRPLVLQPTLEETDRVRAIAQPVAQALLRTIREELTHALATGGPAEAVSVCRIQAPLLTKEVRERAQPAGTIFLLKRTSDRVRNPSDAADPVERQALQIYLEAASRHEPLPPDLLQKVVAGGRTTYRYYQPIRVTALCLTCHGDPATLPPDVKAKLREQYPQDQAVGYKDGDFRGLVVVGLNSP